MVGQELAGAVDQVAEVGVGQRLGADQVVDDLPLDAPTAGRRPRSSSVSSQGEGLGAAGRVGELAEERAGASASGFSGSSMAASERASA